MNRFRLCVSLTYKLVRPLKSFSFSSVIRLFCKSRNLVSGGIFLGTSVKPKDKTNKNREESHPPLNASLGESQPTPKKQFVFQRKPQRVFHTDTQF